MAMPTCSLPWGLQLSWVTLAFLRMYGRLGLGWPGVSGEYLLEGALLTPFFGDFRLPEVSALHRTLLLLCFIGCQR